MPTDYVAYSVAYGILEFSNKRILDFGCYRGRSSKQILDLGASSVLGVDSVEENVNVARQYYQSTENIGFLHIPNNESILFYSDIVFDAATMTFVHTQMDVADDIRCSFEKNHGSLRPGGMLAILSPHPNSFNSRYDFAFYGHNKELPEGFDYTDGTEVKHRLSLIDGREISFSTYFWNTDTIIKMLRNNGFNDIETHNIGRDLEGKVKVAFDKALEELNDELRKCSGPKLKDEWTAPLYQVIAATKS